MWSAVVVSLEDFREVVRAEDPIGGCEESAGVVAVEERGGGGFLYRNGGGFSSVFSESRPNPHIALRARGYVF